MADYTHKPDEGATAAACALLPEAVAEATAAPALWGLYLLADLKAGERGWAEERWAGLALATDWSASWTARRAGELERLGMLQVDPRPRGAVLRTLRPRGGALAGWLVPGDFEATPDPALWGVLARMRPLAGEDGAVADGPSGIAWQLGMDARRVGEALRALEHAGLAELQGPVRRRRVRLAAAAPPPEPRANPAMRQRTPRERRRNAAGTPPYVSEPRANPAGTPLYVSETGAASSSSPATKPKRRKRMLAPARRRAAPAPLAYARARGSGSSFPSGPVPQGEGSPEEEIDRGGRTPVRYNGGDAIEAALRRFVLGPGDERRARELCAGGRAAELLAAAERAADYGAESFSYVLRVLDSYGEASAPRRKRTRRPPRAAAPPRDHGPYAHVVMRSYGEGRERGDA